LGGGEIDRLDTELRKSFLLERRSSGSGLSFWRFPSLSGMMSILKAMMPLQSVMLMS
jgi:hypothetical protein